MWGGSEENPKYHVLVNIGSAPKVLDHLETLTKFQFTDESSVLDVLIGLGTPVVSVAVMDACEIRAKINWRIKTTGNQHNCGLGKAV
jgi:hypothetical protein